MDPLDAEILRCEIESRLSRYDESDRALPEICSSIEEALPKIIQDLVLTEFNNLCLGTEATVTLLGWDPDGKGFLASSQTTPAACSEQWQFRCFAADDGILEVAICAASRTKDQTFDARLHKPVDGLGRIGTIQVSIAARLGPHLQCILGESPTRTLHRLMALAVEAVETSYAHMRALVNKRLSQLSHKFYQNMYGVVGDALSGNRKAASRVVIAVTCLVSSTVYAPDPFAIEASFEAAKGYRDVRGASPIDTVARFWCTFARGNACWQVGNEPSNANLYDSPYASTNWHRWELIMYGSSQLRSLALAEAEGVRIEAWYPSALAPDLDSVLPTTRAKIRDILIHCSAKVRDELGFLSETLPEEFKGGYIGGASLAIETFSPEQLGRVASLRTRMDNENRADFAVHVVGAIVNQAGHLFRGYSGGDHGIDQEIEFKDDNHHATGKRLYLQIKFGDHYLRKRQRDGETIFHIQKPRWAKYWRGHKYRVMLVICNTASQIEWMDVSTYLERECAGGKTVTQIVFKGERFDVESVQRWRDRLFNEP